MAPLEALAQAAGRCNREGRLPEGRVVVFRPNSAGRAYPTDAYEQAATVAELLLKEHGGALDLNDPAIFSLAFRRLYDLTGQYVPANDLAAAVKRRDFPAVAKLYRVIQDGGLNVVVAWDQGQWDALADELRSDGLRSGWIKRARPHTVALFRPPVGDPVWSWLEPADPKSPDGDWFLYREASHYDALLGLVPTTESATWLV